MNSYPCSRHVAFKVCIYTTISYINIPSSNITIAKWLNVEFVILWLSSLSWSSLFAAHEILSSIKNLTLKRMMDSSSFVIKWNEQPTSSKINAINKTGECNHFVVNVKPKWFCMICAIIPEKRLNNESSSLNALF